MIEDPSRSSPKQLVLRALLLELSEAGVRPGQIVIVIGTGTHRQVDRAEMRDVYGDDLVDLYEFVNHDCRAQDLVPIGSLRSGTVVSINRRVSEADLKIGIGSIFPHPMNGFGGGGKILFPAVADFDSILEHHLRYSFREASGLGRLEGNPFYEEVCDLARAAGLDFVINSVLDHNDRLYQPVCGAPVEAHLAGVGHQPEDLVRCRFPGESDVTIISAFPYSEGTQIMKPLAPATEITREGGSGHPGVRLQRAAALRVTWRAVRASAAAHAGRIRPAVLDLFGRNERILPDGAPEFNMSVAQALLGQHDFRDHRRFARDAAEHRGAAWFCLRSRRSRRPSVWHSSSIRGLRSTWCHRAASSCRSCRHEARERETHRHHRRRHDRRQPGGAHHGPRLPHHRARPPRGDDPRVQEDVRRVLPPDDRPRAHARGAAGHLREVPHVLHRLRRSGRLRGDLRVRAPRSSTSSTRSTPGSRRPARRSRPSAR